jgi:UDP-GlcNAc:undecaprenyl-phosphate GlcNAc-1-phosphate transferase
MPLVSWISAGIAFASTALAMTVLRPVSAQLGLLDRPYGHKRHQGAIPVIGGIAMLFGLVVSVLATPGGAFDARVFLVSATILVIVGALDDAFALSARVRLAAHTGAALWMFWASSAGARLSSFGDLLGTGALDVGAFSAPATVFVVVAAINAFNMLDGLDGLAGGGALVALAALVALPATPLCPAFTQIALALLGGIAGFLIFNAPLGFNRPLRSFMGDAGSTLLGFTMATIMIGSSQGAARVAAPVTMVWLVLVPSTDLVWSVIRRLSKGRSPLTADHGHLHHVLVEAGYGVRAIAAFLIGVSGLGALVESRWTEPGRPTGCRSRSSSVRGPASCSPPTR